LRAARVDCTLSVRDAARCCAAPVDAYKERSVKRLLGVVLLMTLAGCGPAGPTEAPTREALPNLPAGAPITEMLLV